VVRRGGLLLSLLLCEVDEIGRSLLSLSFEIEVVVTEIGLTLNVLDPI